MTVGELAARLERGRAKDSVTSALKRATGLPSVAIGLLREASANRLPGGAAALAALVKVAPIRLSGVASIDRAISTAGGVALGEIDSSFMACGRPGTFLAGEMLDWDAPTGGYLLQATFSTGVAAAKGALPGSGWITPYLGCWRQELAFDPLA